MWSPTAGTCAICGAEYNKTSPRQKFCAECRKVNHKQYVSKYNEQYRKDHRVIKVRQKKKELKALERKMEPGNLDKAVEFYGLYGLELVQSFFNVLHRASTIAKKHGLSVDANAIDIIMNDFRQNKIG